MQCQKNKRVQEKGIKCEKQEGKKKKKEKLTVRL